MNLPDRSFINVLRELIAPYHPITIVTAEQKPTTITEGDVLLDRMVWLVVASDTLTNTSQYQLAHGVYN